jgi:uncharacterized protein (TIGR02611 family)
MADTRTDEPSAAKRGMNRIAAIRDRVRSRRGGWLAWRIGVTVVGVAVIAGGIILLPLPGPGWLIIFAGLGLLGTEYEWAKRLLGWLRDQVKRWSAWVTRQPRWVQALIGAAGLVFLAAVAFGAWTIYH